MRKLLSLLGLISPVVSGCSGWPTKPIDGPITSAVVYGYVTLPDSSPANRVVVGVNSWVSGCKDTDRYLSDSDMTDASGHYRAQLFNFGRFDLELCVRSVVAQVGLVPDSVQSTVKFHNPMDSVRVDIVVRPRP